MDAMATGAIGGPGRPILGRQPMIALEKCFYPVGRKPELGVQAFGGMTLAAHLFGNLQRGTGFEGLDLVLGMAVSARGGFPTAPGRRAAMDALGHVRCRFGVAFAASGR